MMIGSCSHIGKVRSCNEDSFYADDSFVVVADGMGGHNKGEVASSMAVEELKNVIFSTDLDQISTDRLLLVLEKAINAANQKIYQASVTQPSMSGMGTTVVAGIWKDQMAVIANVGDSRCYQISDGKAKQLTCDHSLVQKLVEEGKLSQEEAKNHKDRNIITRAVGSEPNTKADIVETQIAPGDILVFCTDGFSNYVSLEEMTTQLSNSSDLQTAVERLVDLANDSGGFDNITLVAVKF